MADMNDFNEKVIDEFRANAGKVGGPFEGAPVILLHHKGAKTGTERVSPLVYQPVGEAFAIFGSKGGAPTNPDWYHNLLAHPRTTVEVGTDTIAVTAREATGAERDPIWEKQKQLMSGFADYERATTRTIPVIVLERS
jgi:deazaflavin-dependent oxidoreductase (nitroreductase family)